MMGSCDECLVMLLVVIIGMILIGVAFSVAHAESIFIDQYRPIGTESVVQVNTEEYDNILLKENQQLKEKLETIKKHIFSKKFPESYVIIKQILDK